MRRLLAALALALALPAAASRPARASCVFFPGPTPVLEDTVGTAVLYIETRPESLEVYIDGEPVGRSPLGPIEHAARAVRIRVLPPDPRRFGLGRDAMDVTLVKDGSAHLFFDLRPSVTIESEPMGAIVTVTDRAAGDSLLGATPVSVPPGIIEDAAVRFAAPAHADTVISGWALVEDENGAAHIELRRVVWASPGPTRKPPLLKKAWFQWTMVGIGTALSVSAIPLHQKADDYYEQYLASSNADEIPYLYDQTRKYDKLAGGALIVGQTLLVSGIVSLLLGQKF